MIIDSIENIANYTGLNGRIASALKYLASTNFSKMSEGRYNIDGDDIYALVNVYKTKIPAEGKLEAHRKYADVQFVAEGCEQIGYSTLSGHNILRPYDDEKDFILYQGDKSFIRIKKGMFAIFFPGELHMPGIAAEEESDVKKVVVKVRF